MHFAFLRLMCVTVNGKCIISKLLNIVVRFVVLVMKYYNNNNEILQ